jgi:hypothetical protein
MLGRNEEERDNLTQGSGTSLYRCTVRQCEHMERHVQVNMNALDCPRHWSQRLIHDRLSALELTFAKYSVGRKVRDLEAWATVRMQKVIRLSLAM